MNKASKCLVVMALVLFMGSVTFGESLKDLAEQEGVSWIAGRWKTTTDEGQDIMLSYRWVAEGNAIAVDMKIGDTVSHGMIYFSEDDQEVKQISVDSKGRITNSTWDVQYGQLISKTSMTDDYGQTQKMGVTFDKVDDKTMKVKFYGIEYGELSNNSWAEMEFKRQVRTRATTSRAPRAKKN